MAKKTFLMPDGETRSIDMPQFKTPYNHDRDFESDRTALFCNDESRTKQEFKDETDINVILERFTRTGEPPPIVLPEHFADIRERQTYFEMHTRIAEANAKFYTLPAALRAQHQNDPTKWADAVVAATHAGDGDALLALGIEIDIKAPLKPQEGRSTAGNTPEPSGSNAASGAPKGAPKSDPPN